MRARLKFWMRVTHLQYVLLFFAHFLSPFPSVMREAAAWIRSLANEDGEDAMATGRFQLDQVAIRVDLLSLLIRYNYVVELEMSEAVVSNSGLEDLFAAALRSEAMETLELNATAFDEAVFSALATLMKRSKSITQYSLICIGNDGIGMICDALTENNTVERLSIARSFLNLEGARSVSRYLKANTNTSLTQLVLALNPLGDEGVIVLVDGLRCNKSLRTLNLCRCNMADDGALALASLLEDGSPLQSLYLYDNHIEEAGLKALANALQHNRSLQFLSVISNPGVGGKSVEEAFLDALGSNVTLIFLQGVELAEVHELLLRNSEQIPAAVRRAALLLIGIRRSTDFEGMGDFAVFPKDIVRLIAQTIYATRRDPVWIQALK